MEALKLVGAALSVLGLVVLVLAAFLPRNDSSCVEEIGIGSRR